MTDSLRSSRKGYSRHVTDLSSFSAQVNRLPSLIIELTDRCNNDCRHCYINRPLRDPSASEREMKTDFIKSVILQAADLGCLDLRFTGGEPLLRNDFLELYRFARTNGFKVHVFTNARLITAEMARVFAMLPPRQPVGITVYGMSAATYEKVSGVKGSFAEFRRGIRLLLENRIDFGLKMAVLPENMSDVPAYESWVEELFAGNKKPAFVAGFSLRARHDDPEKDERIKGIRGEPEAVVELVARAERYSDEFQVFCRHHSGLKSDKLFECGFGRSLSVDAYGFVQGCLLLRHPHFRYDLIRGTLAEAFFNFFPNFLERRAENPSFLRRCARCCLRGLCEQCPAQAWMEHGTLDTPVEFQCRIAHAHARKLGLLGDGENGWEIADWQSRLNHLGYITNIVDKHINNVKI